MKWTFENQTVLQRHLDYYKPFVEAVNRHFNSKDRPVMCFHYCERPKTDGAYIRVGIPWVWQQPNLRRHARKLLILVALGVIPDPDTGRHYATNQV